MVLRLAQPHDFKTFEQLYINSSFDILYQYQCSETSIPELDLSDIDISDFEDKPFEEIIADKYEKIFIIEHNNIPIGLIRLCLIYKARWKVSSFCILPEYENTKNIQQILKLLKKKYTLVFFPVHEKLAEILKEISAEKHNCSYILKRSN